MLRPRLVIVLASVLLFLSVLATWIRAQIIDTEGWTQTSARLLDNAEIRGALSSAISKRLLKVIDTKNLAAEKPPHGLAPLAGVLDTATAQLVPEAVDRALRTQAARSLWVNGNRTAHAELIKLLGGGGEVLSSSGGVVAINLEPLLDELGARLGVGSQIAAGLAPKQRRLVLLRSNQLHLAQTGVKALRDLSFVLPLLVVLLYLLALAIAPGLRRRVLLEIGAGVIVSGLFALLARRWTESYVLDNLVKDEGLRPPVRQVLAIVTSGWGSRATWLLATGVAIVVAGVLTGAAGWARWLRRTLAAPIEEHIGWLTAGSGGGGARTVKLLLGLASIAVAILAVVLAIHGSSGQSAAMTAQPGGVCEGSHALCSRRLDQVVFPATHNSMSATSEGFRFANQQTGIAAQLRGGIRGLLIDTHPGVRTHKGVYTVLAQDSKSRTKLVAAIGPVATAAAERIRARLGYRGGGSPQVYLCHAFCEIGASPAVDQFRAIRDFLLAHPGEVLLVSVEDGTTPQSLAQAVEQSGLLPLVWRGPLVPSPTLGAMVASDQRVVFMVEGDPGTVSWLHPQFQVAQETPYDFTTPAQLLGSQGCSANRGGTAPPLLLINMFIDSFPPSAKNAAVLNARQTIVAHARTCAAQRGRTPTLIAVDDWQIGDVVGAARELNSQALPSAGAG